MLPADVEEKMARFLQDVYHVRQNGDFSYDFIANIDETPVFFDMVPSCVVEKIPFEFGQLILTAKNCCSCLHSKW